MEVTETRRVPFFASKLEGLAAKNTENTKRERRLGFGVPSLTSSHSLSLIGSEFRKVFSVYFLLSTVYFLSPLRAHRGLRAMFSSARFTENSELRIQHSCGAWAPPYNSDSHSHCL